MRGKKRVSLMWLILIALGFVVLLLLTRCGSTGAERKGFLEDLCAGTLMVPGALAFGMAARLIDEYMPEYWGLASGPSCPECGEMGEIQQVSEADADGLAEYRCGTCGHYWADEAEGVVADLPEDGESDE